MVRCEFFDTCMIYKKRGAAACKRAFQDDRCPPLAKIGGGGCNTATGTRGKVSTAVTGGGTASATDRKELEYNGP